MDRLLYRGIFPNTCILILAASHLDFTKKCQTEHRLSGGGGETDQRRQQHHHRGLWSSWQSGKVWRFKEAVDHSEYKSHERIVFSNSLSHVLPTILVWMDSIVSVVLFNVPLGAYGHVIFCHSPSRRSIEAMCNIRLPSFVSLPQFQLQMFDIVCSLGWTSRDKCCDIPAMVRRDCV